MQQRKEIVTLRIDSVMIQVESCWINHCLRLFELNLLSEILDPKCRLFEAYFNLNTHIYLYPSSFAKLQVFWVIIRSDFTSDFIVCYKAITGSKFISEMTANFIGHLFDASPHSLHRLCHHSLKFRETVAESDSNLRLRRKIRDIMMKIFNY